jgi:hypothetical protein
MNPIEQDKFIAWLKQYPRHGAGPADDAAGAASALTTAYQNMENAGLHTTGVFADIRNAMSSLKDENTNLAAGFNKTQAQLQILNKGFLDNIDAITKMYQRNDQLSKSYGLTGDQAQDYGYQIDELSVKMGFSRENTEKYIGSLGGLTNGFISSEKSSLYLNESLINQQRYLTDIIGLSDSAAESVMEFNAGVANRDNKDAEITTAQLEKQLMLRRNEAKAIESITGLKGVQRTIDTEIAAAGAEVSLQYSRNPKTLGLAVMKSKALGLSMSQMAATGDKLLNIEESVGNELEYQLLSGKRLVNVHGDSYTNMYRAATLSGDMNKQASIMHDILDSQGEVLETNVLARKQLAATLGIEESTMAKMVQKRKLLKSMGAEKLFDLTGNKLEEELEKMRDEGKLSADTMAEIMTEDDTRPVQVQMAESLANIETKGILARFATKGDYTANYTGSKAKITSSMGKYAKAITGSAASSPNALDATGLFEFNKALGPAIGALSILGTAMSTTNTAVTNLATAVPLANTALGALTTMYTSAVTSLLGASNKLENYVITGTGAIDPAPVIPDGVMVHDGVVNFNPRDKFTRVNDGMTVAGTNVGGIDRFAAQMEKRDAKFEQTMSRLISQMATQTKTALESANIKITPDRTFSSNSLNKGRYA